MENKEELINLSIPKFLYTQLEELATEYFSQNNRMTAYPIYFQIESEVRVDDCFAQNETGYLDAEGGYYDDITEIESYCADREMEMPEDFSFGYDDIEGLHIYNYRWGKQYTGYFLTASHCEDYIKYKSHRLSGKNHRSYCKYGGNGDTDLPLLTELLRHFQKQNK